MYMNLALIVVHNKGSKQNFNQIEILKTLLEKISTSEDAFDDEGNVVGTITRYHYQFKEINVPHRVDVYQILPYQSDNPRLKEGLPYEGIWPSNAYDVVSHKVAYGTGDEDKVGDHPRFFNWGLKRSTDYGANVVIYLEDIKKLDLKNLVSKFQELNDKENKTEYAEDSSCKIATLKLLKTIGQVDEGKSKSQALSELKEKVVERGMRNG